LAALALLVAPESWPLLAAADGAVVLLALLDLVISPRPDAFAATRFAPERMSVLSEQVVSIRVKNRSRLTIRVEVRDSVPPTFTGPREQRGSVPAEGEQRWDYRVTPQARGKFEWGPIFLRYRSLLGFWTRTHTVPAPMVSRVYPNLSLLERYRLLARTDRLAALGIRRIRVRGGATEFESLREYAFGDDTRQIDWKATARRAKLTVRHREAGRNQTVLLLIDCGRLMNAEENGVSKLDHAINAALLLANVALSRGDRVGLCVFSGKVHSWLVPRGNTAQSRLIGETLYAVAGDFTESDHGRCLKFVASRYPKRSLLVVLTDFVDAVTAADMVSHLQLASRRHVVLFTALKDAFLERAAVSVPTMDVDGFRKAAAIDLLRERQEVLELIRHSGGLVIDAAPGDIAPPMLNGYLEVMLGGKL
jgi:uncharacterized protein (DUF58 family)